MGMDDSAEIYGKYREELHRYATTLVGASDAEDVVSTVVLRIIRKRGLEDLDDPRAYLFKSVLNESRGYARRRKHTPLVDQPISDVPVELLDVVQAVMDLPLRQRAAVFLYYWESEPIDEIARLMNIVPGAVKRYLHLARKRLKGALR